MTTKMVFFSPIRRLRNTKRAIIKRKFDYVYLHWPDEFKNRIPEGKPFIQQLIFPEEHFTIEEFEAEIEKFVKSPKGKGIVIELPLGFSLPLGIINQLHAILQPIKDHGKEIIVISKLYDSRSYYFASIANKILLIRGGIFNVSGASRTILYMKNALDKLGVEFEKIAVSGFKSALDNFTRNDMSPEARENIEWLLQEETKLIGETLFEKRKIDYKEVINNAPYTDKEALSKGFIDAIVDADEIPSFLAKAIDKQKIKIVRFGKMHKFLPIEKGKSMGEVIAVIPVTGGIIDGDSIGSPIPIPIPIPVPFADEEQVGDKSILRTIRKIASDPTIIGTILFVDSPGGSVFASETMRGALENLRNKMPVVAYFNSVSASGGYYISTPADWIVSEPGCITGSIGVFNAKISMKGFLDKNELNPVTVKIGDHADWSSLFEPYSENEKKIQEAHVEYTYQQFLSYVAESRKKPIDEIKPLAGGRVYLGTQAKEYGLVDELGSLKQAKEKICELKKKNSNKIPLVTFHPPKEAQAPLLVKNERDLLKLVQKKYSNYLKNSYWLRDFGMDYK